MSSVWITGRLRDIISRVFQSRLLFRLSVIWILKYRLISTRNKCILTARLAYSVDVWRIYRSLRQPYLTQCSGYFCYQRNNAIDNTFYLQVQRGDSVFLFGFSLFQSDLEVTVESMTIGHFRRWNVLCALFHSVLDQVSQHDDYFALLLPDHPPEVGYGRVQWCLACDVVLCGILGSLRYRHVLHFYMLRTVIVYCTCVPIVINISSTSFLVIRTLLKSTRNLVDSQKRILASSTKFSQFAYISPDVWSIRPNSSQRTIVHEKCDQFLQVLNTLIEIR